MQERSRGHDAPTWGSRSRRRQSDPLFLLRRHGDRARPRAATQRGHARVQGGDRSGRSQLAAGGAPGLERGLVGRDADVALEWLQEIGVIRAVFFRSSRDTVDLAQEAGRPAQGSLGPHLTGRQAGRAAPSGALGRAGCTISARWPTRTFTRDGVHFTATPRSARACSTRCAAACRSIGTWRARSASDQAITALEPVQRPLDRQRRAPFRPRDGGAPGRPARSVARRHHLQAPRPSPGAAAPDQRPAGPHRAAARGRRGPAAPAARHRQRAHDALQPAAVAEGRRAQADARGGDREGGAGGEEGGWVYFRARSEVGRRRGS